MSNDLPVGGWYAHVQRDSALFGVTVMLAQRIHDAYRYVTGIGTGDFGGVATTITTIVDAGTMPPPAAHLRIEEDAARALYDALAQHFAGEAGSRQTRADLLHERGRVDQLIETVSSIALAGASRTDPVG